MSILEDFGFGRTPNANPNATKNDLQPTIVDVLVKIFSLSVQGQLPPKKLKDCNSSVTRLKKF